MNRRLAPVLAAALAAACGGRAAMRPGSGDVSAVKARAAAAQTALDRAAGVAPVAPASGGGAALPQSVGSNDARAPRAAMQDRSGRVLGPGDGCTWVIGESTVAAGAQDTREQVRASAIAQARAAAVQNFLGVDIHSRLLDFEQEGLRSQARLTESLLLTTRNGRVLDERVLGEGYRDDPDCPSCSYYVALKDCVAPLPADADKDFRVELGLSRTRFVQGDAAQITVTPTRDCTVYLYDLYNLGAVPKTALVVPNEAVTQKSLKAGETWTYPDADAQKAGIALTAQLPDSTDDVSAEVIRVVASKVPLPPSVYDPAVGGWFGVMRRLSAQTISWTDDAAAFTIYRK